MVSLPLAILFLLFSLALMVVPCVTFLLTYFTDHNPITAFALVVLGPLGLLGVVIWGAAIVGTLRGRRGDKGDKPNAA